MRFLHSGHQRVESGSVNSYAARGCSKYHLGLGCRGLFRLHETRGSYCGLVGPFGQFHVWLFIVIMGSSKQWSQKILNLTQFQTSAVLSVFAVRSGCCTLDKQICKYVRRNPPATFGARACQSESVSIGQPQGRKK